MALTCLLDAGTFSGCWEGDQRPPMLLTHLVLPPDLLLQRLAGREAGSLPCFWICHCNR
jgi:hypothetical protein